MIAAKLPSRGSAANPESDKAVHRITLDQIGED